ncbi:hypothetical protein CXB51_001143 [Gossypium anomalum]|uniref:DUF7745 domain-containing protein n=1 Tax=Gossypium anomalum TaxID=47600 RepID=A0A8J5ZR50_9ROSI|nr:hypothetical protein CXB51_001143 [Gossypium anomalum]
MENEFLDKVEDNAVVRIWSEKMQLEKGDSLTAGYTSELWDFTRISLFYDNYGDLPYLLDIKIDKHPFQALAQFWNPAYSFFTFENVDLAPTVEEYTALLRCARVQVDNAYSRATNVLKFVKKLMNITGMSEQWVTARIKQKGESKCIPWKSLRDLILVYPDVKKRVNVFALSIYRCAQLLLAWFHSHFWKVNNVSYRVFSENYSPLKKIAATLRQDDISEERWIAILQNLQEENVEWRAPWLVPNEILFRCGNFD